MPNKITDMETVMSCFDAAYTLGISMDRLRVLARAGKIGHRRIGHFFWFTPENLAEYRTGRVVPVGTVTPKKSAKK
jgi:hypothetical protein